MPTTISQLPCVLPAKSTGRTGVDRDDPCAEQARREHEAAEHASPSWSDDDMVAVMASTCDFRFGLHFWTLPVHTWVERVRQYERLGFSSITFTDHQVVAEWEPMAAFAAGATVTGSIAVGPLVLDKALRNPVRTVNCGGVLGFAVRPGRGADRVRGSRGGRPPGRQLSFRVRHFS